MSLYPNPGTGKFELQFPNGQDGIIDIRVMDVTGRVLFEKQEQMNSQISIDLKHILSNGTYYLKAEINGHLYWKQIMVFR